ncbi:necrosis inducing-like protein NPP1 type [Phytophthora sojae]|uniref:Necrosis inducing-like protein NPP1 type n=1 Tax=Phytophthora sojae (strain P6497) TaxID=1094619 RepID=G5A8P0_PHYSP|nr:necrosis inducing-like protein NPP1 type [Phytophthora sojae]EGZ08266.1 necrosis inducing-like protein NPP1 type [Phytophthora sojae]|eukprot:XP_009536438.1 necrosis inducing-like protein NPP1 type [Phytophthora sojae]
MNLRAFLAAAAASLVMVEAEIKWIDHDQVQSFPQPEPVTDFEKFAVKYKPQLHISNGCHPYPAVQADVYSRSDWYRGKWTIMYAWYFPKGRACKDDFKTGHRHFWEDVVVWVDNPNPDNSTLLGVPMYAGHRHIKVVPVDEKYLKDGKTVKFGSYKSLGAQVVGLTEDYGEIQDLITWEQLTVEARTALSEANFHVDGGVREVVVPIKDGQFEKTLESAYPADFDRK